MKQTNSGVIGDRLLQLKSQTLSVAFNRLLQPTFLPILNNGDNAFTPQSAKLPENL